MVSTTSRAEPATASSPRPWGWLLSSGRGRLVLMVLLAQAAMPFAAFTAEPPSRFGFQMYSGLGGSEVVVRDEHGDAVEIDLGTLVPSTLRPELDWTRRLPEHLCSRVAQAAEVEVAQLGRRRTLRCG